ncbi:MAG: DUF2828 family protein [Candidatus Ancillula sp.]|nr:DUF2828 family protein [Candidatus Ancillula sp.]
MNFKVTSYRNQDPKKAIKDFIDAFAEDRNLAVKWLFFVRDAREGLGERELFRWCFNHLISTNKSDYAEALIKAIPEFGRFDDLLVAMNTQYEDIAIHVMKKQLDEDLENMAAGKPVSLCAKWMPRENTSNKSRIALAKKIATAFGMSAKEYRKMIAGLNKYLKTVEVFASAKDWKKIDYNNVPSLANLKYKNAFMKNDATRRQEYLAALERGEAKINMSVGYPHDIVHAYIKGKTGGGWGSRNVTYAIDPTLEAAWKALKNIELSNTMVVGDSSGSMETKVGGTSVMALEVAHALGIYCADHNSGAFKNKMITFSEHPKYLEWNDNDTLATKLGIAFSHSEVANTNIEKVFELILDTAVKNHCAQEDLPKQILIISDCEFDRMTSGRTDITLFKSIEKKFAAYNYKLPKLCFWNVCGRTGTVPVQQSENGVALVSGFSVNTLKMILSDKLDPYEALKDTLNSERYKDIIWE